MHQDKGNVNKIGVASEMFENKSSFVYDYSMIIPNHARKTSLIIYQNLLPLKGQSHETFHLNFSS
jgi:hypothetical protein